MKEICFEQIDSTNTYCKSNYLSLDDCTFVSAKSQSSGKGRENRIWQANKDENLLFSLCLKDKAYFAYYQEISIVTALTILSVLKHYDLTELMIKWPNDVYCNHKKICGILLEALSTYEMACLIIGVGVNVNQVEFKHDYRVNPTSMKLEIGHKIDIEQLKKEIYQQLLANLQQLINGKSFYQEIQQYDYLKDKKVYAIINQRKTLVKVVGINEDYSLKVQAAGQLVDLQSGEISFHI